MSPAPTSAGPAATTDVANADLPLPGDRQSASASAPQPASPEPPPKLLKASPTAVVAMALVALVGVVLILRAWELGPFDSRVETTDNAYVRGAVTVLSPQVSGYVTEVLVKDFDPVGAGQPLARIDDRLYAAAVAQAEAQRAGAVAQLDNFAHNQAQNQAALAAGRATLTSGEG